MGPPRHRGGGPRLTRGGEREPPASPRPRAAGGPPVLSVSITPNPPPATAAGRGNNACIQYNPPACTWSSSAGWSRQGLGEVPDPDRTSPCRPRPWRSLRRRQPCRRRWKDRRDPGPSPRWVDRRRCTSGSWWWWWGRCGRRRGWGLFVGGRSLTPESMLHTYYALILHIYA